MPLKAKVGKHVFFLNIANMATGHLGPSANVICGLAGGRRQTLDKNAQTPHPQKRGKLANSIFFRTQLPAALAVTATTEFANRGKLSGKVANSFSFWGSKQSYF